MRELWLLREQARVQAAERCFLAQLQRLLESRSTTSTASPPPTPTEVGIYESSPRPHSHPPPARERPGIVSEEVEALRARQFVTGLSPEFRALLEGTAPERELVRSRSFGNITGIRPVSDTLESEFRHQLEALVARREPQPRTRLYANDTGAYRQPDEEMGYDASLRGTVEQLREEVGVMKNMMSACFDLQLDVQRAIRQEVSAAMNTAVAETSVCTEEDVGSTRGNRSASSQAVASGVCTICLENRVDSLLYGCGHMCTCSLCGRQLVASGQPCPICRAPVRDVVRAYVVAEH